jgi:transcription elongation factor Elf1
MNRKYIDYAELAKQKKREDYAKAISKLPTQFIPQPSTQKTIARAKVHNAKKSGKLVMQPCQVCGELKTEAHHPDYTKPLDVVWLCKDHHMQEHYPWAEKRECVIEQQKYTEAQIIDNVSAVIKSKHVLHAFIKRHSSKMIW